jgi:hypothetical protein
MDVEATLDALESTLGGTQSKDLSSKPSTFPAPDPFASASTLKLSAADIQAAISPVPSPAPHMGSTPSPGMPLAPPTKPSALPPLQPTFPEVPAAPLPSPISGEGAPAGDANLLKVQVGSEIYQNLMIEQVSRWIEEGRIMEYHMVARQFSENWIEASKVPSLRPIFERVRRARANSPDGSTSASNDTSPVKKSLFGGLFKG